MLSFYMTVFEIKKIISSTLGNGREHKNERSYPTFCLDSLKMVTCGKYIS